VASGAGRARRPHPLTRWPPPAHAHHVGRRTPRRAGAHRPGPAHTAWGRRRRTPRGAGRTPRRAGAYRIGPAHIASGRRRRTPRGAGAYRVGPGPAHTAWDPVRRTPRGPRSGAHRPGPAHIASGRRTAPALCAGTARCARAPGAPRRPTHPARARSGCAPPRLALPRPLTHTRWGPHTPPTLCASTTGCARAPQGVRELGGALMENAIHRFIRPLRLRGVRVWTPRPSTRWCAPAGRGCCAARSSCARLFASLSSRTPRRRGVRRDLRPVLRALVKLGAPDHRHGQGHGHDDLSDEGRSTTSRSATPSPTPRSRVTRTRASRPAKPSAYATSFKPEDLAEQYNLHQEVNKIDLAAMTDEIMLSEDNQGLTARATGCRSRPSRCTPGAPRPDHG